VARDLLFFLGGYNLDLLSSKTKRFQSVRSRRTNLFAVLPDASCENEKVDATEECNVRPDCFSDRNGKYIQRERRARIVGASALFERLYIAFARREREESTLMVEQGLKLIGT
jgi:hypothetical protein